MTTLADFNADPTAARELLGACLDVPRWVDAVAAGMPYSSVDELRAAGAAAAATVTWPEVAAALDRHPRIGERTAAAAQTGTEAGWSRSEQAGVQISEAEQLSAGNAAYEQRFGWIFLICASGLSGTEILAALRRRLTADPEQEKPVVIGELRRIAELRLAKAVSQ
jgi:2-oxo-4-hydroxy-4-carboxy-5-ureidoimidazoline decarboxylase